ncbi:conjugative transposon protein TraM [Flavobacterium aquiphilum]|uniref:conjugative transposon protein TraM n=1 Tax=Flavobacterium aquiphilum TaxID=3003261 RepID=UPI00248064BC|nr:conjugative transposon protein TraM [Flavobacterium aquiphilum]
MEKKTLSFKELKKRKMLLMLPLITLPFITLLFWSFGGGRTIARSEPNKIKTGFNADLPVPNFKDDKDLDKMSYYDKAASDSIKLLEEMKKDPNYSNEITEENPLEDRNDGEMRLNDFRKEKTALNSTSFKPRNEEKVYQKLKALQKLVNQSSSDPYNDQDMGEFENKRLSSSESSDMNKLEQMMSTMSQSREPDPELKQLGGMLENILDIQHPSRVEERIKQSAENKKGAVLTVDRLNMENTITSLERKGSYQNAYSETNSFYSLDEDAGQNERQNSIEAVVHESQIIVSGSIVKLRLSNDVNIGQMIVPKNSFLFGTAAISGERLQVKINTIKYKNSILPVELSVYDMDGIAGIYIPGAINRDVAKASADRSIQSLGLSGLDDSWKAQAAELGIEAAKSLVSKKVKLVKVVVKAGYQVLLYDEKQKNLK